MECQYKIHEFRDKKYTKIIDEIVQNYGGDVMAARLTDRQKNRIIADYVEFGSYNAAAKVNGVAPNTVKKIVQENADVEEMCNQKKEEDRIDMLAFMDSRKDKMQEAIDLHLCALTNSEKIADASLAQIATSFGIIVDKATRNTAGSNDSINKLDGLLREFKDAVKS